MIRFFIQKLQLRLEKLTFKRPVISAETPCFPCFTCFTFAKQNDQPPYILFGSCNCYSHKFKTNF